MPPGERPLDPGYVDPETIILGDYVLNSERKMLIVARMSLEPGRQFTAAEIAEEANGAQGPSVVWEYDHMAVKALMRRSLVPSEVITATKGRASRGNRAPATLYQIDSEWTGPAQAHLGTVMEWSNDPRNAALSVMKLLGQTASPASRRAPEVRYGVLRYLLDQPGMKTTGEIYDSLDAPDYDPEALRNQLKYMGKLGLLVVDSRYAHNPKLKINPSVTEYSEQTAQGMAPLNSTPDLIVRALGTLYPKGTETREPFTVTLKDLVTACSEIDPEADLNAVRNNIVTGANTQPRRYWRVVREPDYDPGKRLAVSIRPDHKESIEDYCKRLADLENPDIYDHYRQVAKKMVTTTEAIRTLMEKAIRFSPHHGGPHYGAATREIILEAVRKLGWANVEQIHDALGGTESRVGIKAIYKNLAMLEKTVSLSAEMRPASPDSRGEVRYYRIGDSSEDDQ